MSKLICIYNICGISGRENLEYYDYAIDSLLRQEGDFKVIVSACLSADATIDHLTKKYAQKISINLIQDKVPVNVSFNHSVRQAIKYLRKAECYAYIDSGCAIPYSSNNILSELYNVLSTNKYGMVSARTNTDTGFPVWLGIGSHDNDSEGFNEFFRNLPNHYEIPLGKAINLHFQLFSHEIFDAYNNILPDIFAGQCSESVLSFVNAAINKKWVIHKDIEIEHLTGLDIPSVGFSPPGWTRETGRPTFDHPFIIQSVLERIRFGMQYGLGYEEVREIAMHDTAQFDENGFAKNPMLKEYIKANLYLQPFEFDYNKMNSEWI